MAEKRGGGPEEDDSIIKRWPLYLLHYGKMPNVLFVQVMRVAPAPLYNSFGDVWKFVQLLGEALQI